MPVSASGVKWHRLAAKNKKKEAKNTGEGAKYRRKSINCFLAHRLYALPARFAAYRAAPLRAARRCAALESGVAKTTAARQARWHRRNVTAAYQRVSKASAAGIVAAQIMVKSRSKRCAARLRAYKRRGMAPPALRKQRRAHAARLCGIAIAARWRAAYRASSCSACRGPFLAALLRIT
jgi:hypothetical protein